MNKKYSSLLLAVFLLGMLAMAQAKQNNYAKFMNYYMKNPDLIPKRPPMVQANSLSAFFTNFWHLFAQPGTQSTTKLVGDFAMFYVVPFLGGYQRVNSFKIYNEDKYTFDNA